VLESHAVLIRTPVALSKFKEDWVERLLMRIDGVEQVKESKYIMLHAPRSALPASAPAARQRIADGHSARGFADKVADARGVPRERVLGNAREPEEAAGASAMLVLPVEKMLA
jgi:ATP phosphoribosyltransferase